MNEIASLAAQLAARLTPYGPLRFQVAGRPHPAALQGQVPPWEEFTDLFRALYEHVAPEGGRTLTVEMDLAADGRYTFSHTLALEIQPPPSLVLDPTYRYPNHPAVGMPRPAIAEPSDRPTDPATLAAVRALVERLPASFPAGLPDEDVRGFETALGFRLPEDLRALYRTIGGGPLGDHELLPLPDVVERYFAPVLGSPHHEWGLFERDPVVKDPSPPGRVRRVSRSDWWLTFAIDADDDQDYGGDNHYAVDLDPGPTGVPGQVVAYGMGHVDAVGYVAESVTALLEQLVGGLRSVPPEPGPGVAVLNLDRGQQIEETSGVQELYLNDGATVDLAALAPLRTLRTVSVWRAGHVDCAIPHDVPIEGLTVEAATVDFGTLGAHPTLWHLTVSGVTGPVRIAPLASLPELTFLDVADLDVVDLDVVASMPNLRVLGLRLEQWRHLRERGALPATLAGVAVLDQKYRRGCGPVPLPEVVALADLLGAPIGHGGVLTG